jgi:hypothetical protein
MRFRGRIGQFRVRVCAERGVPRALRVRDRRSLPAFAGRESRRGGVLMEYVLVTAVTLAFFVGVSGFLFDPGGSAFTVEGALDGENFGFLGDAFTDMYRLIMQGIALPIP